VTLQSDSLLRNNFDLFISYRIFQIAIVLFSPMIGTRQSRFGRKNMVFLGYLCLILGCLFFGLIDRVDNRYYFSSNLLSQLFLLFSVLIRFLQGFGSACIQVSGIFILFISLVFSMVALKFPNDKSHVFGACESAIGMGMMTGPILGQIFYYFDFEGCFYGTGVLILICGFISHCFMPESLNRNVEERRSAI
jgi:MFS family permease